MKGRVMGEDPAGGMEKFANFVYETPLYTVTKEIFNRKQLF